MRIYFDTEFIEDGKTIDLLSIGMVRDDGGTLYLENSGAEWNYANAWVRENVLPKLDAWPFGEVSGGRIYMPDADTAPPQSWRDSGCIAQQVVEFVGHDPEFWAYYADYDWVVLCQLYGRMIDLPDGWPKYCRDFKQWLEHTGFGEHLVKLPEAEAHNALADARWLRNEHQRLINLGSPL